MALFCIETSDGYLIAINASRSTFSRAQEGRNELQIDGQCSDRSCRRLSELVRRRTETPEPCRIYWGDRLDQTVLGFLCSFEWFASPVTPQMMGVKLRWELVEMPKTMPKNKPVSTSVLISRSDGTELTLQASEVWLCPESPAFVRVIADVPYAEAQRLLKLDLGSDGADLLEWGKTSVSGKFNRLKSDWDSDAVKEIHRVQLVWDLIQKRDPVSISVGDFVTLIENVRYPLGRVMAAYENEDVAIVIWPPSPNRTSIALDRLKRVENVTEEERKVFEPVEPSPKTDVMEVVRKRVREQDPKAVEQVQRRIREEQVDRDLSLDRIVRLNGKGILTYRQTAELLNIDYDEIMRTIAEQPPQTFNVLTGVDGRYVLTTENTRVIARQGPNKMELLREKQVANWTRLRDDGVISESDYQSILNTRFTGNFDANGNVVSVQLAAPAVEFASGTLSTKPIKIPKPKAEKAKLDTRSVEVRRFAELDFDDEDDGGEK